MFPSMDDGIGSSGAHPGVATLRSFAWLTGLLEAEGTFLRPPPSSPRHPVIRCSMTDRDVVERVAAMFGTKVHTIEKRTYRTAYFASIKGSRAVALMRDLRPGMGARRSKAIGAALTAYAAPDRKLSFTKAEAIRAAYASGQSVSALAREYGVRRATIRPILKRRIYREPMNTPWRAEAGWLPPDVPNGTLVGIDSLDFCWLAGWLEGEGSFVAPPPSDPRRPRIVGSTRDRDVIDRVGRLLRIKPQSKYDLRAEERGWSPTYTVLKQGGGAVMLMLEVAPIMGRRRSGQITAALDAAAEAKNGGAASRTRVRSRERTASTGIAGA